MADVFTPGKRSEIMARIRGKNTSPELFVRRVLHGMGYRFRLHVRSLPGCPDIVLPKLRTVIQIKGCFWHQHSCKAGRVPRSNLAYWLPKLTRNKLRDRKSDRQLRTMGWRVLTLWECKLEKMKCDALAELLQRALAA